MPKKSTRQRRANKRGGQAAMPPYVAPPVAAPPVAEKSWGETFSALGAKLDPRKLLSSDPTTSNSLTGGRKRSRTMRGGKFGANAPLSLATNASPISGISSARAHSWVGGRSRSRKYGRSRSRSRKYGRSRRHN